MGVGTAGAITALFPDNASLQLNPLVVKITFVSIQMYLSSPTMCLKKRELYDNKS
jgi:hypothetical protein